MFLSFSILFYVVKTFQTFLYMYMTCMCAFCDVFVSHFCHIPITAHEPVYQALLSMADQSSSKLLPLMLCRLFRLCVVIPGLSAIEVAV